MGTHIFSPLPLFAPFAMNGGRNAFSRMSNMAKSSSATVAIVHTNEKHRSADRITGLVRQALDHLGGMSRFVRSGQTVLIKPNQTVYYSAEEGCTTDPLLVAAVIRLAYQAGAK